MTRKKSQTIPPADALLCERCGYDLAGLTREMDCPECGMAVGASLPERVRSDRVSEVGSVLDLFRNCWHLCIHPVAAWDRVEVRPESRNVWRWLPILLIAFIPGLFVVAINDLWVVGLAPIAYVAFPVLLILLFLIKVEEFGIRFFGRRNGWRITKDVSRVVVTHASFTWVLSALGTGLVWVLFSLEILVQRPVFGPFSLYAVAMFLAFLPGLLWFETLVWIGVRKLRYANIPGSERHLADHGPEARAADPGECAPATSDG